MEDIKLVVSFVMGTFFGMASMIIAVKVLPNLPVESKPPKPPKQRKSSFDPRNMFKGLFTSGYKMPDHINDDTIGPADYPGDPVDPRKEQKKARGLPVSDDF